MGKKAGMEFILLKVKPVLMKNLFYYKLREAEMIRNKYMSWIGREAHIGGGRTAILKSISIKLKKGKAGENTVEDLFKVEFEFAENKKFSAYEFFYCNSLPELYTVLNNNIPKNPEPNSNSLTVVNVSNQ
jgi:hypothetical protein